MGYEMLFLKTGQVMTKLLGKGTYFEHNGLNSLEYDGTNTHPNPGTTLLTIQLNVTYLSGQCHAKDTY